MRVALPYHLRVLAQAGREVELELDGPATLAAALDALEARYPALRGTIRDRASQERRPFIRFFTCGEDWSHRAADEPLPQAVARGKEPLRIVGAMAGG